MVTKTICDHCNKGYKVFSRNRLAVSFAPRKDLCEACVPILKKKLDKVWEQMFVGDE